MKSIYFALLTVAAVLIAAVAQAEISGSGRPNANCASARVGGAVLHEISGSGIHGVSIHLADDDLTLSAVTDESGQYLFEGLCEGDYDFWLDLTTIPGGLTLLSVNIPHEDDDSDDDSDDDAGTQDPLLQFEIELEDDDSELLDVDFRFGEQSQARCALSLDAGCAVAPLASELYECSKNVNQVSMVWNGSHDIRVVAYNGHKHQGVIADIPVVSPGETVTVQMHEPHDDAEWEIYEAGTDIFLGDSKFRLACDDIEMDGPEDCLLPQGDGKDNKAENINDWQFYGLRDASGGISCAPAVYTDTCEFQAERADCDLLDEVFTLTLVYEGGSCDDSRHHQPDKFECEGAVNAGEPALVTLGDDTGFVVQPGEAFTIPKDGSDTEIELSNSGGTQELRFHTSCSKPLAANDVYGGLRVGALNGVGVMTPVEFQYVIANHGDADAGNVAVAETVPTLHDSEAPVYSSNTVTLHGATWVETSVTNTVLAVGDDGSEQCAAADLVSAVVIPPADCNVAQVQREYHDKELRWTLDNDDAARATVERVEISWPYSIAGKLKEMLLDGDKFFDEDVTTGQFVVDAQTLEGELRKRRIAAGDARMLKIKFDREIEGEVDDDDIAVTVFFEEGCSITW